MRKTLGLRDRACKGFVGHAAASSEREIDCYLHGLFPEEKLATESFYSKTAFEYVEGERKK